MSIGETILAFGEYMTLPDPDDPDGRLVALELAQEELAKARAEGVISDGEYTNWQMELVLYYTRESGGRDALDLYNLLSRKRKEAGKKTIAQAAPGVASNSTELREQTKEAVKETAKAASEIASSALAGFGEGAKPLTNAIPTWAIVLGVSIAALATVAALMTTLRNAKALAGG